MEMDTMTNQGSRETSLLICLAARVNIYTSDAFSQVVCVTMHVSAYMMHPAASGIQAVLS